MIDKIFKVFRFIMYEFALFLIGGLIYFIIENIFRGFGNSHWSMIVVGGICFVLVGLINEFFDFNQSFILQTFIAATIILFIEFVSGVILNIILGLNVWDYSDSYLNILGQICPRSYIYWLILSPIGIILDDYLRYFLFDDDLNKEKPHYKLF